MKSFKKFRLKINLKILAVQIIVRSSQVDRASDYTNAKDVTVLGSNPASSDGMADEAALNNYLKSKKPPVNYQPTQCYLSQTDLIWPDSPFTECDFLNEIAVVL